MAHAESNLKTKSLGQSLDGRLASNGLADRCAFLTRKWAGFGKQAAWALVVMARLLLGCGLVPVNVLLPRKAAVLWTMHTYSLVACLYTSQRLAGWLYQNCSPRPPKMW